MTSTPTRAVATAIFGALLGGSLACSLIFNPRDDVDRCGNVSDCPPMSDNRYRYECRFDDESASELDALNVDKVCIPAYRPIGCAVPDNPDDPLGGAWAERARASNYVHCSETPGVQGCPPEPGVGCAEGLTPRADDNICDDDDPNTPPAIAFRPGVETSELVGQDVLDQFCRSFFCDESFVCDTRDHVCNPCDPDRPFGRGGCGELYSAGKPMCTYQGQAELDAACAAPDSRDDAVEWGDCTNVDPDPTDTGDTEDDPTDPTDPTEDPTGDDTTTGDTGDEDTTGDTGKMDDTGDGTTTG